MMTRRDDRDADPVWSWHGVKFRLTVNLGTVLALLVFLAGQGMLISWTVSGSYAHTTAKIEETQRDVADLKRRVDNVEKAQIDALKSYAEITEKLGKLSGQNDSILAMLRDLQGDRRIRLDGVR